MSKKEDMFALVEQWRESGMTRKSFATKHGITDSSFEYWCRKHDNTHRVSNGSHPDFIELCSKPVSSGISFPPKVELDLPGGIRIKIY